MRQARAAGKLQVISTKGGENNVFNHGLVVRNLAHRTCTGSSVVQAMCCPQSLSMREITGARRAVPKPELGAGGIKVADQHLQHASGKVVTGTAKRGHRAGKRVDVVLALRLGSCYG